MSDTTTPVTVPTSVPVTVSTPAPAPATPAKGRVHTHAKGEVHDDANDPRIDRLLRDLAAAKKLNTPDALKRCKSLRRALRDLDYFGASRKRSSKFFDLPHNALKVASIKARAARIAARIVKANA